MKTVALSVVTDDTETIDRPDNEPTPDTDTDTDTDSGGVVQENTDAVEHADPMVAPPEVEAKFMDPNELIIDENVRQSFDLDDYPEQEASIRERGVRAPALAERGLDGKVRVYDGQLRVLLARRIGLESVPVWITPADPDRSENENRIERTLDQIILADRRIPLPEVDRARGIALMFELGATPTRVARGLQGKRTEIARAGAIGASPTATRLLDERQFDLDQLAVIADYESRGDTDAVTRLEKAASWNFAHTHRLIERQRTTAKDRLEVGLAYAVYGFGILTQEPEPGSGYVAMESLVTQAGEPVSVDDLYAAPDRWLVWLAVERGALLLDTETGARVEPAEVDWDTRGNPDAQPDEGLRHADTVTRADDWTPTYYLPENALPDSAFTLAPEPAPAPEAAPAPGAQADPQAQAAALLEREQARLARRRVRVLNEHGEVANPRRREFLPRLFTGATLPQGTAHFVAVALAHRLPHDERAMVAELLGLDDADVETLLAAIESATANRAWKIVLAMQVAHAELPLGKSLWRDASADAARYLRFLADAAAELGRRTGQADYALSEVEQAAAGLLDYEAIDITT
ncbi:ParB/RepB/Spo0J family partition protein [Nocardia takedensis]|uniref:ParB/RepB/Spo0J family partition protein n=1 Tax=Nocardia takedensis TaxID=259390 RepID=UPI003F75B46E